MCGSVCINVVVSVKSGCVMCKYKEERGYSGTAWGIYVLQQPRSTRELGRIYL